MPSRVLFLSSGFFSRRFLMFSLLLLVLVSADQGADVEVSEKLSAPEYRNITRLDGTISYSYCSQVLEGHAIRKGKWVILQPPEDPYGFTTWLNSTRASYGLSAVSHDPNLTNWASMNNSHQASRGMGHYTLGPARRQNSAMGNYASIGAMWMASPPHRAALLDPSIRWIGIAGLGAYWTYNAN
jgi:hypothetical protein